MTKQIYDARNKANLNKLADNTKVKAKAWYEYCKEIGLQVLIYETIRDRATQARNVAKGVSKTMRSYHIVGQALDFVAINSAGKERWNDYNHADVQKAIKYAQKLGFTWGGDWDSDGSQRDETFIDSPHLQYGYKGYGTDTFGKRATVSGKPSIYPLYQSKKTGNDESAVKTVQKRLNLVLGLKLSVDGIFGAGTTKAVKQFQKEYKLVSDGIVGATTYDKLKSEYVKKRDCKK